MTHVRGHTRGIAREGSSSPSSTAGGMALSRVLKTGVYIENDDALQELLTGEDAMLAVINAALAAKERAKQIQPDRTGEHDLRIFAGGYEERVWDDSDGHPVATCYVGSFSGTWHLMEFGSAHNMPFRPLTSAVESIGLEFRPS